MPEVAKDIKPRPERILMVGPLPPPVGGMATVVENLTEVLGRRFRVDVLNTVKTTPADRSVWQGARAQLALLSRLARYAIDQRPLVVHIHTCSYNTFWRNTLDLLLAKALGRRALLHIHGAHFHRFLDGLGPVHARAARLAFGLADAVVVLGGNWDEVLRPWVRRGDKLHVLPNAVPVPDLDAEHPAADIDAAPTVVTLANYERRKGQEDLIRAVAALPNDCPLRVRLHGADGEPGERERLEALVTELGLEGRVAVCGPVIGAEKARMLQEAAVFCLPSYHEGLPMAMLEAMSYGLPVVVTNVGSIPEVIEQGRQGLRYEPGDVETLRNHLLRLCGSPELRRTMGAAGRESVIRDYSMERNAEQLASLYVRVAGGG